MGSLILCHKKRAKQPYEITRVHVCVHTIEELCYYVCNNLYLIDHTIMNRQLCYWIDTELEMDGLAGRLREEISRNCTQEQFVIALLKGAVIYSVSEINKIQIRLDKLKNQKEVERAKFKADCLMSSGEYEDAILVYQSIVYGNWDDSVSMQFYGHVYGCLGTAYGRMFLYKEAADAYKEAYRLSEETDMLKAYLYCCMKVKAPEEYVKMLSGNAAFLSMDAILKEELKKAVKEEDLDIEEKEIERWKSQIRNVDKK